MPVPDQEFKAVQNKCESYRAALEEIVNPLKFLKERADRNGDQLSGMAFSIVNDRHYLQNIARDALKE